MRKKSRIPEKDASTYDGKAAGFTLVELLLGLAISAVIVAATVSSIYSIMITMTRGSAQTVSQSDINRAALAIKNDLLMTQTTNLTDGVPYSSASLNWTDNTASFGSAFQTPHSAAYTLAGKELTRTYDGEMGIVGRNIAAVTFTQNGKFVHVSLSSTVTPTANETIAFSIHLRSEEQEQ